MEDTTAAAAGTPAAPTAPPPPPPPSDGGGAVLLTESDVDAFAGARMATAVLRGTDGNRCQSDECMRIKILATLRYRSHPGWQAFVLDRYLTAAAAAAGGRGAGEGRLRVDFLRLVEWGTPAPRRWLFTGGPGVASPAPDDTLCLYRVELSTAADPALNAVAVHRAGGGLVVLPFSAAAAAAALRVPWASLFGDGRKPVTAVKVQQSERPWVSLLWLHACLVRYPRCDAVRTLSQTFAATRSTAIFEFQVCDELVPPLRDVRDMERRHLAPFDRERRRILAALPPLREVIG